PPSPAVTPPPKCALQGRSDARLSLLARTAECGGGVTAGDGGGAADPTEPPNALAVEDPLGDVGVGLAGQRRRPGEVELAAEPATALAPDQLAGVLGAQDLPQALPLGGGDEGDVGGFTHGSNPTSAIPRRRLAESRRSAASESGVFTVTCGRGPARGVAARRSDLSRHSQGGRGNQEAPASGGTSRERSRTH